MTGPEVVESAVAGEALSLDSVRAAARQIAGVAHHTPVITSATVDAMTGAQVVFKAENLQRAGAFKFRGAYTKISTLTAAERARGVCTWSSGNHAQAVALAATLVGTHATVLMPHDAPAAKRAATEGYGATVVSYDRYHEDREALARDLADAHGLVPIPAFDDWQVMAGQGTTALELIEDAGPLDTLVVPLSGGGLMAGCGTAARGLLPDVELIGVEPSSRRCTRDWTKHCGQRCRDWAACGNAKPVPIRSKPTRRGWPQPLTAASSSPTSRPRTRCCAVSWATSPTTSGGTPPAPPTSRPRWTSPSGTPTSAPTPTPP